MPTSSTFRCWQPTLYGNFIPGERLPASRHEAGRPDRIGDDVLVEGNPAGPISLANAVRTGHQFLIDVAHSAVPVSRAGSVRSQADAIPTSATDALAATGSYDDELLDAHYIAGDGRVNENIGLTAVHAIFHSEHNRLVEQTKDVLLRLE